MIKNFTSSDFWIDVESAVTDLSSRYNCGDEDAMRTAIKLQKEALLSRLSESDLLSTDDEAIGASDEDDLAEEEEDRDSVENIKSPLAKTGRR